MSAGAALGDPSRVLSSCNPTGPGRDAVGFTASEVDLLAAERCAPGRNSAPGATPSVSATQMMVVAVGFARPLSSVWMDRISTPARVASSVCAHPYFSRKRRMFAARDSSLSATVANIALARSPIACLKISPAGVRRTAGPGSWKPWA